MNIVSVSTIENGDIRVELTDGRVMFIPDDMTVRARKWLKREYEDIGGVIPPYVPPPEPTEAELDAQEMEKVQLGSIDRAFFELMFEMANQIRVLQGKAELTKAQFANYAKTKLRA